MPGILVTLVSDQTIPNVLFIRERTGIDQYLFVSTPQMEYRKKREAIIKASGLHQEKCLEPVIVDENSLSDIEQKLSDLKFEEHTSFIVNLTGGTKVMTVGCYHFFQKKGAEIIYIPIGKNNIIKIFPESGQREFQLNYRIGVADYLISYGIQPATLSFPAPEYTAQQTESIYSLYLQRTKQFDAWVNQLRNYRNNGVDVSSINQLSDWLSEIGFESEDQSRLNKYEVQYLTGGWFEEWAYHKIKSHFQLSEGHIALNTQIRRENTSNEFDILFTLNNAIHVIECKTNIVDVNSDRKNELFFNTAYKLAALRKDFGLFAKTFIFTLSPLSGEPYASRSRVLDINLADHAALSSQNNFNAYLDKLNRN